MHIVVIGGGVSGLASALALTRRGHTVTVVERDPTTAAPSADPHQAFAEWVRSGAPQVRQSHAFLALLRNTLRDRAPDVLEALFAAGTTELTLADILPLSITDRSAQPGDEDLVMLACRRITYEWVLRAAVSQTGGVTWKGGSGVASLHTARLENVDPGAESGVGGTAPVVDGVVLENGDVVRGDLVVDASGRRSPIVNWLAAIGVAAPVEESHDCGIVYYSRFYRFVDGAEPPPPAPANGDLGYVKYGVFRGDNRTFSLTLASYADDRPMRALGHNVPFDACVNALPALRPWVEPTRAEPISDVGAMAGLLNRSRHFLVDDEPIVSGLVVVGDAAMCTNPLYGRGCALGTVHAYALADVLNDLAADDKPVDLKALSIAFDAATKRVVRPFYASAVRQDLDAEKARAIAMGVAGPDDAMSMQMRSIVRDGLMPAIRTDPVVFRAFMRSFNLLEQPEALMADPDIVGRVMASWQDRENRPPEPSLGPVRDDMLALIATAEASARP